MTDNWANFGISLVVLTIIGTIVGGTLYGCDKQGERHLGLATKCVQAGGSWIETASDMCINTRDPR